VRLPYLVAVLRTPPFGLAAPPGSAVQVTCAHGTPEIETDPRRVRQILLNLLSNALKFGERRPVHVRCGPTPAGGVRVEVVDEGVGIPRDRHERIFEEFVQLPSTAGGGTGLGLPISRRLARLLGGTLTVRSAPGEGSTFTLELPGRMPE
jgi:signal transduction histidine kinase